MRRNDREISDFADIIAIIEQCKVMRLAMSDENMPYVVPLNFGYFADEDGKIEFCFHCANVGKKLDILRKNPSVCLEMDCEHQLTTGEIACHYGYNFKSVIAAGTVHIVEEADEKRRCLEALMKHQTGKDFTITEEQTTWVTVGIVSVSEITGKERNIKQ